MEMKLDATLRFLLDWLNTNVLTWNTAAQWACVLVLFLLVMLVWRGIEARLNQTIADHVHNRFGAFLFLSIVDVGNVLLYILALQLAGQVFRALSFEPRVLDATSDLAVAWILIRLLASIMPNRALARFVSLVVWTVAALSVFGLLSPITDFLQNLSLTVGETSFNALGVIKGLALAALYLQLASFAAQLIASRIKRTSDLTPSLQVLLVKAVKVLLFTTAVLFAMSSVGIDLTSLAIFSSALGVGIGFGLKTIFSNYVAGLILLMDNSIKPGDTIEVDGIFGVVRNMYGRYASLLTRDGMEYLIPNELLISGSVINWTYSDTNVRIKIPVGVSYGSDVPKALKLLEQAAHDVPRVLRVPPPFGRLMGFGDSSVDLELRAWIADAEQGIVNVRSDILLKVWEIFHANDIEFPFPQRDVLLKQDSALAVTLQKESDDKKDDESVGRAGD